MRHNSPSHSVGFHGRTAPSVVIAKAGKPKVRVVPLEAAPKLKALGFLAGPRTVKVDLSKALARSIGAMFTGAR